MPPRTRASWSLRKPIRDIVSRNGMALSRRRAVHAVSGCVLWGQRQGMKIVMMGSGGVGGYFGARLAAGGADVHFVARGAHLAAMRSQGLAIEGGPAPLHLPKVQATNDPASIGVA